MEYLFTNALKIESVNKTESDGRVIVEGYACHFNKPNGNYEIVDEKSFSECLKMLKDGGQMPVFNYQHTTQIIGGWDEIKADTVGLHVKGHLNTNVADVKNNILPLLEAGDVCHLSTEGWYDWEDIEERDEGCYLKKSFLTGISLVALPADFEAKISMKNKLKERAKQKAKPLFLI